MGYGSADHRLVKIWRLFAREGPDLFRSGKPCKGSALREIGGESVVAVDTSRQPF